MHLERATRSLRSEGRHSGHRARKEVYRGNRTGQDNVESCESGSEERSAENPHATICGGGHWVTTPSTRRGRVGKHRLYSVADGPQPTLFVTRASVH